MAYLAPPPRILLGLKMWQNVNKYLVFITVDSFIIEIKPKMLSVSDLRTDGHIEL